MHMYSGEPAHTHPVKPVGDLLEPFSMGKLVMPASPMDAA